MIKVVIVWYVLVGRLLFVDELASFEEGRRTLELGLPHSPLIVGKVEYDTIRIADSYTRPL